MVQVVAIEAVAIALLALLVCGLLRSHAEILRKLHELGVSLDPQAPATDPTGAPRGPSARGGSGFDVVGITLSDVATKIGVVGARQSTMLAFLSSGCLTCASFWERLTASDPPSVPGGARVVIVTRDAGEESESRIRELAPSGAPVIMSSQAWRDYDVPGAPYFVYVDGAAGRIVGQGSAQTWDQVSSLWQRALDDEGLARGRAGKRGGAAAAVDDPGGEDRADRDLLGAGIHPGHPSLFPRRGGDIPPPGD